ncbi:MAG: hypothetical protein IJ637_05600 [Prevotella sp.]|nr:hypothetical protein [Prevotella sp.]
MKRLLILSAIMLAIVGAATAQESHYHKGLRSQADNDKYGTAAVDPNFNGGGVFWSRVRNVDDTAITHESREDSIARRAEFVRLCEKAYDAYEEKDYYHTIIFGDSALTKRYHTPDLYYFMGVSFEKLGDYKNADWGYKKAMQKGYTKEFGYYPAFKERMKQRKAEEKLLKQEEKKAKKKKKQG